MDLEIVLKMRFLSQEILNNPLEVLRQTAQFALRMLKRNGVHPRNLRSVYCYFIRPVLEYACPVWHSSLPSCLSDQVEHIQRRATKVICPSLSYSQSLTELELPTLFDRRESSCKSFYRSNLNTTSKLFDLLPKPVRPPIQF